MSKTIKLSGSSQSVLKPFIDFFCQNHSFNTQIKNMNLSRVTTLRWISKRITTKIHQCGNFEISGKKLDILMPLFMLFKNHSRRFPAMLLATLPEHIKIVWCNLSMSTQIMDDQDYEPSESEDDTISEDADNDVVAKQLPKTTQVAKKIIFDDDDIFGGEDILDKEETFHNTLYVNKVEHIHQDILWKCQECQEDLAYFPDNLCLSCTYLIN